MKKILSTIAALAMMPCVALSDGILAEGWQQASMDDLIAARAELDRQIAQLSEVATADGMLSFSGTGVTILDGFALPAGIWYRKVTYSDRSYRLSPKLTESVNNKTNPIYFQRPEVKVFQCTEETAFDYLSVEIDCDWTIDYIPLDAPSSIECSGESCMVRSFVCNRPTKITLTASRHNMDRGFYGLDLFSVDKRGRLKHIAYTGSGNLEEGETAVVEAIVNPSDDIDLFIWQMVCDAGVSWSISCK